MIKKVLSLILLAFLFSCSSSKTVYKKRTPSRKTVYKKRTSRKPVKHNSAVADKIVNTAFTYKGTRYKYGGTSKRGMDCSGLIMTAFNKNGKSLPRTSYDMSNTGKTISLKNARKGDLLFFTTNPRKPRRISHVGLVTEVKNGIVYFIHASTKRGVTVNNMSQNYYKKNYAKAKRVL
ncbi:C40 family peptidase [Tenacibaculum sp. M341]|uniref:C40 family peptidase n=1 Tax=Tenacibaculum sp. M341 TaxID=2530339 RepID=UPI001049E415|nr:C40 family peptidase [Tenacibaculum sp. M341]TCI85211.1 NlpC/P60 family protein [Tenacibaculum sp. M341]